MWTFLGATPAQTRRAVQRLRPFYGAAFSEKCTSASPEVLSCMETAENAFTGLARCGLNAGRPFTDRLITRPLVYDAPSSVEEDQVTDPAEADALRAALIGAWDRAGRETWVFTAGGGGTKSVPRPGDTPVVNAYRFTTTSRSRFFTTRTEEGYNSASPEFWSAVVEGDSLYLSLSPDGMAQRIEERGPMVMTERGFWLIQDIRATPRCTGFTLAGQPVQSARCAWEGEGDARRLWLTAAFGHGLDSGEPVGETSFVFREMAGLLVPADISFRFFRRVAQGGAAPTR